MGGPSEQPVRQWDPRQASREGKKGRLTGSKGRANVRRGVCVVPVTLGQAVRVTYLVLCRVISYLRMFPQVSLQW